MSEESMTPKERIDTVLKFKEPDRVPCGPFLNYYLPFAGGYTVWEFIHDSVKSLEGAIRVYKKFNGFDIFSSGIGAGMAYYNPTPKNGVIFASTVYVKAKLPRKDVDPMSMPQFPSEALVQIDDTFLDGLLEKGLEEGLEAYAQQTSEKEEMYNYSAKQAMAAFPDFIKFIVEEQVYPYGCGYFAHPGSDLGTFYGKNWKQRYSDFYRKTDKLIKIFDSSIDSYIDRSIMETKSTPEDLRMLLWAGGGYGIRPEIWERVYYPTWKKAVHAFCREGLKIWFHLDGDLTSVLELLGEIFSGPARGRCILQFDQTDMYKAKEILGDKVCLSGNLKASLMSLGTPHEVDKECKRLIENLGEGSGYVLGCACEIPYDAKFENVKAMRESVDKYRIYR